MPRTDHAEVDFQISPFSKCFASTLKRKAGIFKFLRFLSSVFEKLRGRDGFAKTIGQIVEITLRVQIFPEWFGRGIIHLLRIIYSGVRIYLWWKLKTHLRVRYFECLFTTFDERPLVTDKVPFLSAMLKNHDAPHQYRYSYSSWRSLRNQTTLFALKIAFFFH